LHRQALKFPRSPSAPLARGREYPWVLARSPSGQPRLARPPAGTLICTDGARAARVARVAACDRQSA